MKPGTPTTGQGVSDALEGGSEIVAMRLWVMLERSWRDAVFGQKRADDRAAMSVALLPRAAEGGECGGQFGGRAARDIDNRVNALRIVGDLDGSDARHMNLRPGEQNAHGGAVPS